MTDTAATAEVRVGFVIEQFFSDVDGNPPDALAEIAPRHGITSLV
jgi:hypothetical protein